MSRFFLHFRLKHVEKSADKEDCLLRVKLVNAATGKDITNEKDIANENGDWITLGTSYQLSEENAGGAKILIEVCLPSFHPLPSAHFSLAER